MSKPMKPSIIQESREGARQAVNQGFEATPGIPRRFFLKSAGFGMMLMAGVVTIPNRSLSATLSNTVRQLAGDKAPESSSAISIDVPSFIYDGAMVPIEVSVESPMTKKSHVRHLHLVAEDNPVALVASYTFTPESGLARVRTRIRLERKQMVVVLAELNDGRVLMSQVEVDVALGGCSR